MNQGYMDESADETSCGGRRRSQSTFFCRLTSDIKVSFLGIGPVRNDEGILRPAEMMEEF